MPGKKKPTRDIPISLQGIETILQFLNENYKEESSIRSISEQVGLSMRVVKNILLQLERFNQVERVVEKNKILPKWKITKFGRRVIKQARDMGKSIKFPSIEDELIYNITIPEDLESIKDANKKKHESLINELDIVQVEISRLLGSVLNLDNPIFEDLMSFMLKRMKFLKTKVSNLSIDPTAVQKIKKVSEKQKKISKQEEKYILLEIYFLTSIISNELKRISDFNTNISYLIENEMFSKAYTLAKDLREEIRTLTSLINQRESIRVNSHILPEDSLKILSRGKVDSKLLDNIIQIPLHDDLKQENIKDIVLKFLAMLKKGEKQLNDHNYEISENIPLFALYQLILDEKPHLIFSIEELEQIINSLATEGYIPGIRMIQEDHDHFLKIVQFKAHDISEDERKIISIAIKSQKFSLADMIDETGWTKSKVLRLLEKLTSQGILKYSKSFLHGENWYIISEKNI